MMSQLSKYSHEDRLICLNLPMHNYRRIIEDMIQLQTFSVASHCQTVGDLVDGVVLAQVLNEISPSFFSTTWLSKIKLDIVPNDWRLKVSNLKKILKGIANFYAQTDGPHISDLHMPDVNAIGEHENSQELGRLLQLVLGCAVNCDDKPKYIQRIMGLEESVQHDVMKAIQDLMTKEPRVANAAEPVISDDQTHTLYSELRKVTEQKDSYAQRCHDLDTQVVLLQEEKINLVSEIDRLNERLNQAESLDDPSSMAGRRYVQLQKQVQQLQEDLYRTETSRDEYRIKADLLHKEIGDLQEKNQELESVAEEMRKQSDELDILRHTAEKVPRYEATISSYKKKLEEMSDLKGQLKILEASNLDFMKKNFDLEEDVKKGDILKAQLDVYRRQVQDLQLKLTEETKRNDKAEFDCKRLQEKVTSFQQDKERLTQEIKSSQEAYNELLCTKNLQGSGGDSLSSSSDSNLELLSLPSETRERFLRLQHENQKLKMQASSGDDSQLLRSQLDDANVHKHELECQVRSLNQKVLELEANLSDLNEVHQKISESEVASSGEARKRWTEQVERCQQLEADLQKRISFAEDLDNKLQASNLTIGELKNELARKDLEVKETEEKYKKYLKKAETLLRQYDSKTLPTAPELTAIKTQLENKDQYIKLIEQENEKIKSTRDMEEKLMATAWYNLTCSVHRKSSEDRLTTLSSASLNSPQSFLARQRQVHMRRAPNSSSSVVVPPNTTR